MTENFFLENSLVTYRHYKNTLIPSREFISIGYIIWSLNNYVVESTVVTITVRGCANSYD